MTADRLSVLMRQGLSGKPRLRCNLEFSGLLERGKDASTASIFMKFLLNKKEEIQLGARRLIYKNTETVTEILSLATQDQISPGPGEKVWLLRIISVLYIA